MGGSASSRIFLMSARVPRAFLPTPTMTSTPHRENGRDLVIPTLDALIQTLNIAKDVCGIPPAQIALGSASTLLTMIRVHSPLLRQNEPLTYAYLGHDGELSRLRRPWEELRQRVSSTPSKIEGEKVGRAQRGRLGCDWRSDYVSKTSGTDDKRSRSTHRCTNRRSVTKIQRNVDKHGKRHTVFRFILAKSDKDKIAAWNQELLRILHVFNVRSTGPVENLRTESLFRPSWRSTPTSGSRTPRLLLRTLKRRLQILKRWSPISIETC